MGLLIEKRRPGRQIPHQSGAHPLPAGGRDGRVFGPVGHPHSRIVLTLAGGLLGIVCLVLAILGIVNAAQGLQKPLPVIGTLFSFIK